MHYLVLKLRPPVGPEEQTVSTGAPGGEDGTNHNGEQYNQNRLEVDSHRHIKPINFLNFLIELQQKLLIIVL